MARAGLFGVPGHEPGQGACGRALRIDQQPQFHGPSGTGCAHASRVACHGGGGGAHRAADRRARIIERPRGDDVVKKIFWLLTLGALASAAMAATLGRAEDLTAAEAKQAR